MSQLPFTLVTGKAAPMLAANIDTDVIMPKQFLKGIDRSGLDRGLFFDLRFLPSGELWFSKVIAESKSERIKRATSFLGERLLASTKIFLSLSDITLRIIGKSPKACNFPK